MPSLVVLVAVVAAYKLELCIAVYFYLVDKAYPDALSLEWPLGGFVSLVTVVSESVLAKALFLCLQLFALALESDDNSVAGNEVFVLGKFYDKSSAFGPFASVGGA